MNPIQQLDRILRGEATDLEALRTEQLRFSVPGMALVLNTLGLVYGACMGVFAVTGSGSGAGMQVVASMVKVPALFVGTLLVTFPSLYVFNALFGSRLRFAPMLRLLLGSMAVALASVAPLLLFYYASFQLSEKNYDHARVAIALFSARLPAGQTNGPKCHGENGRNGDRMSNGAALR